jgi:hypothetical protein
VPVAYSYPTMLGLCLGHLMEQQEVAPTGQRQWLIDAINESVAQAGEGHQIEPESVPTFTIRMENAMVAVYVYVHATWVRCSMTTDEARRFAAVLAHVAHRIDGE